MIVLRPYLLNKFYTVYFTSLKQRPTILYYVLILPLCTSLASVIIPGSTHARFPFPCYL